MWGAMGGSEVRRQAGARARPEARSRGDHGSQHACAERAEGRAGHAPRDGRRAAARAREAPVPAAARQVAVEALGDSRGRMWWVRRWEETARSLSSAWVVCEVLLFGLKRCWLLNSKANTQAMSAVMAAKVKVLWLWVRTMLLVFSAQ